MRFRTLSAAAAGVIACACTAGDPAAPPTTPPRIGADGANLRPVAVQFTQGSQNSDGSIPLVVGMPAAANVLVERSRESVAEVPVVLRLFRGQTLLRVDTARTSGVLSKSVNPASPSVQFLISGTLVTDSLAWQVEVDPAQLVADSVRTDNQLPATPALLNIVPLPPLHVHFVPIVLAAHAGVTGDVSASNAEQYLAGVRALLPTGALTFSIGTPLTVQQSLGTPPDGGALNFWSSIVADVDIARLISTTRSSIWYGIVPAPTGFTRFTNGGYAYIPSDPAGTGGGTRSAVSLEFRTSSGGAFTRDGVAHELGHIFGRSHAPGCGAGAPMDAGYPFAPGTIGVAGHDVFNWANGNAVRALSQGVTTGDVMSYCSPAWSSPYTWEAVLRWRQNAFPVIASVARTPVTLVAGSISAHGRITLRPALSAEASLEPTDRSGDVTVEWRDASGTVTGTQQVASHALADAGGERHFIAMLPTSASLLATQIVATHRGGASATIQAHHGPDIVSARRMLTGATAFTSSAGNALLVRDAATGDVLGIGWNGRVDINHSDGITVTVSDGVRSHRAVVVPR